MGAAFGSGASAIMFGSAGATGFRPRLTTFLAVGFRLTFALAWSAKARNEASLVRSWLRRAGPGAMETSELPESEAPAGEGSRRCAEVDRNLWNRPSRVLNRRANAARVHPLAEVAELVDALA